MQGGLYIELQRDEVLKIDVCSASDEQASSAVPKMQQLLQCLHVGPSRWLGMPEDWQGTVDSYTLILHFHLNI